VSAITAYSSESSVKTAVNEIKEQLSPGSPKIIMFFAAPKYDGAELSSAMKEAFPETISFGCSTAGELIDDKMLKESVVAMGFGSDIIADAHIAIATDVKGAAKSSVSKAVREIEEVYGNSLRSLSKDEYVGIVLHDGMGATEEDVMDEIGNLSDITFIGGSAGDDCKFESTQVFAAGKAYSNACVLAVLKAATDFSIIKTQSFSSTGKKLITTKVDEATRTILEFNGKPASKAYAEALELPEDQLADKFMKNPVGLSIGDDFYVRSPQQVKDGNVVFYCSIQEGMELDVLSGTDIVKDTQEALEAKKKEMGGISALINFHCILRTLQLYSEGKAEEYGKVFKGVPTIGLSTYGESYIGHINQTSTMLVFK
jgi:hypothetical protein